MHLTDRQIKIADELVDIANRFGQFNQTANGDGAHYRRTQPFADEGWRCENCIFRLRPVRCRIVKGQIASEGICKYSIISQGALT